jgi:hypothetical protein
MKNFFLSTSSGLGWMRAGERELWIAYMLGANIWTSKPLNRVNNFPGGAGAVPLFTSVYTTLRYVGLFSRQYTEAADILHSASSKLPQGGSGEALMLHRALERPLHLLKVPEEWDAFISRLLD